MRSKHLLAITLLLPFLTMSSVANAGQTHWQKAARLAQQRVPNVQAAVVDDQYRTLCTYQGGPKTNTWSCW
jgi:hypothetical protein